MTAMTWSSAAGRTVPKVMIVLVLCAGALASLASAASAEWKFNDFSVSLSKGGALERHAGSHPDMVANIALSEAGLRNTDVTLPPGLVGNPTAVDACPFEQMLNTAENRPNGCPATSQIGVVELYYSGQTTPANGQIIQLYNLVPPPNQPALFAFAYQKVLIPIEPQVRPSDYSIVARVRDASLAEPITGAHMTIWGVPADDSHERMGRALIPPTYEELPIPDPAEKLPFLRAPTSCPGSPTPITADASSWFGDNASATVTADPNETPFTWSGCFQLPFEPKVDVAAGAHAAGGATGLDVTIEVPQSDDPKGYASADVRKAVVTLPKGFAISSSAANGQTACSEAEIGIGSNAAPTCPASSSVGSVKIKTPLLDTELEGEMYLAQQKANPFGTNFAMYLAAKGPGFFIKLPGKIEADPSSGQLTTTFDNLPQLPFESATISLRGGPQAALVAPESCGTYTTQVQLTSWASSKPKDLTALTSIDESCSPAQFDPGLHAGTAQPLAGGFSPFTLQVTRADGEQDLSRIQATLPEGVLAKLAGVPLCADAAAAIGDCPAASRIGATTVGAGPGSNPVYVPQPGKAPTAVYLGGPYKGAPYSLVVKVPAQAGPFDLGTVTVRNALAVDPTTAQVTAQSDPLPQILEGVPISYRDVRVEIDRGQFTINPTSCEPMQVTSTLTSVLGATANPSSRFKVVGCRELGFKPSLKLALTGEMNRSGNPVVRAVLKAPKDQANIAKTTVVLPKSEFIDNAHISNPCTRVQFNAGRCPAGSILGTATAYTPLLDQPLSGPVYFRSNGGERELPDLVADLDGQIHITLVGFIDTANSGGVRTRFANVPDAPVSKFVLKLKGGKKGLIENSHDLCSFNPRAKVQMTGQNGKTANSNLKLGTSCRGKSRGKGKK